MCVTFRRRLVSVRHCAYLQHCADGIAHLQNSSAFILNGSSLCKLYWNFPKTTHANFGISQNRSSKFKTIVRSSDWVITERTRPRSIACIVPRKLEPLFDQWPDWRSHHYVITVVIKFHPIHLFAIGGGQSPKLIQHRSKTRHLTQQLVQRDWPMCVTIRRNLVSVRHSA